MKKTINSLVNYFWFIVFIIGLFGPIVFFVRVIIINIRLSSNSDTKIIKAIVINEKNYVKNSAVNKRFYYSYEFEVDDEKYIGNTLSSKFEVGDSVKVKYYINNPSYNEIIEEP